MIRSSGPPDKTTPGNVGDIYQNTDNGKIFVCKDVKHRPVRQQFIEVSAKDVNTEYVWETTSIKFDDCTELFKDSRRLEQLDKLDFNESTNMKSMFQNCKSLTTIPQMNTSKVIYMASMFQNCSSLTTAPQMDTSKVTNMSYMFQNCGKLTNLDLRNIKTDLQIGSGTSWGHLLTVDSLVNTIKELVTQTSYKTLTMGTANLEKIANLYCKIIDNTDPKKTMQLCESTEEGAMTLTDYAQLKKWNIK